MGFLSRNLPEQRTSSWINNHFEGQEQDPVEARCLPGRGRAAGTPALCLSAPLALPEGNAWTQLGPGVPLAPVLINQILRVVGGSTAAHGTNRVAASEGKIFMGDGAAGVPPGPLAILSVPRGP